MRKVLVMLFSALSLSGAARAQIPVTDATGIAQGIINSANELLQSSSTAENMVNNFRETVKIYEQGRAYYDRLRSVTNLVREGRKVQESILLVGELTDIYIRSYNRMLADKNFTPQELSAIAAGYNKLLQRGANTLRDLKEVVNPTELSMTDKDRLDLIDRSHRDLRHTRDLMMYYTRKNIRVSYLRAQEAGDTQRVLELYGSQSDRAW